MMTRRSVLAVVGGAMSGATIPPRAFAADTALAPADGSSIDAREAMLGSWRVVVVGEKRARLLVLEAGENDATGAIRFSGGYGYEGIAPSRIAPPVLAREGEAVTLRLVTGAKSIVAVTWVEPGRFEGTIEYPQTDQRARSVKPLTMVKLESEAADASAIRDVTRPRAVMVLYVGAWNCPACLRWKKRRVGEEERALLARVALREVDAPSYADLTYDPAWPEDLKIIRDRYKIKSGSPRFYVFADARLAKSFFGGLAWERDVLPTLRRMLDAPAG